MDKWIEKSNGTFIKVDSRTLYPDNSNHNRPRRFNDENQLTKEEKRYLENKMFEDKLRKAGYTNIVSDPDTGYYSYSMPMPKFEKTYENQSELDDLKQQNEEKLAEFKKQQKQELSEFISKQEIELAQLKELERSDDITKFRMALDRRRQIQNERADFEKQQTKAYNDLAGQLFTEYNKLLARSKVKIMTDGREM